VIEVKMHTASPEQNDIWNTKILIQKITLLKTWSLSEWTIPPAKKAHPRTSSIFDNIEPSSDCWTTRIIPFFSAYMEIIISVAFPKVALRSPPTAFKRERLNLSKASVKPRLVLESWRSAESRRTYLLSQCTKQVACRSQSGVDYLQSTGTS
jgi:hypothetical protein